MVDRSTVLSKTGENNKDKIKLPNIVSKNAICINGF